ncbi:MAG: metallophosphoesterase [bacterium]|nr:metallophosphoesterase [bacterium]
MLIQAIIIILYLLFIIYIFKIEPNLVKISNSKININNLPNLSDYPRNLTIIHISDLHIINLEKKDLFCINKINEINSDLILVTGDLVANVHGINPTLALINSLKSKYGIYGVFGNEEYQSLYYHHIEALINSNITILRNEYSKINLKNNQKLYIIGLDDPVFKRDDLEKSIHGLPSEGFKILLTHSPEITRIYPGDKLNIFNLILSGHVHGGQVRIPFVGPLIIPFGCERKYNSGLHKIGKTYLSVNRGIGTCPLTVRLFCRPEISIIKLNFVDNSDAKN